MARPAPPRALRGPSSPPPGCDFSAAACRGSASPAPVWVPSPAGTGNFSGPLDLWSRDHGLPAAFASLFSGGPGCPAPPLCHCSPQGSNAHPSPDPSRDSDVPHPLTRRWFLFYQTPRGSPLPASGGPRDSGSASPLGGRAAPPHRLPDVGWGGRSTPWRSLIFSNTNTRPGPFPGPPPRGPAPHGPAPEPEPRPPRRRSALAAARRGAEVRQQFRGRAAGFRVPSPPGPCPDDSPLRLDPAPGRGKLRPACPAPPGRSGHASSGPGGG